MTADTKAPTASAVLILGMARSGTSAVTRLLALLGVALGPEEALLAPAGENAKGFFEHRALMGINKELLERMGGSWSDPPRLVAGWQRDGALEDLRARARETIAADFADAPLWAFKDPRTSLTLPFWEEILGEVRYVVCHRRPLDSARSLEKRDGIRLDEGVALWTRYTASALAHSAGAPRILIAYEQLFSERQALVGELADFIGAPARAESLELQAAIEEWVDEDLRHHAGTLRELVEHPAVSAEAQALHLLLGLASASRRGDEASGGEASGDEASGLDAALDGMAHTLLRHEAARAVLSDGSSPRETAPVSKDIRVSIVLVLADDPWGAMASLESIAELTPGSPEHEVVLVDNASRGLRATLDALAGEVRILRLEERVDAQAALQAGVEVARGELVVPLPEPALLAPDALTALWAARDARGVVPASAIDAHLAPPPAPLCRRGPGAEQIEVSIVIPTLDAASVEVRECVRAVQATVRAAHEIIIIDNGAPPQGFTAPVNAALRAARGEHLVVMNDDVRVLDGWWEPLADALRGGAPLVFPLTVEGRMRWEFAAWCFAMSRETFAEMAFASDEFFDPSMVVWCQDADLRKRLAARGTPPLCIPESRIRHAGSRTVRVGAPHHALRSWIGAQAASDTAIFRARYPEEVSASDGLAPAPGVLTPEHAERRLGERAIHFRAEGPEWESQSLVWPTDVGHFFLAGEIEVQSADSVEDILVRAVFAGEQRELYWMNLVPGVIGTGRLRFTIPRERARAIRLTAGEPPADWSQVQSLRLCARSRLRGALHRAPAAPGASSATLSDLRLLALPAEVAVPAGEGALGEIAAEVAVPAGERALGEIAAEAAEVTQP